MKKVFAVLLTAVLLLVPCAVGASAEGALNEYEQQVIDVLSGTVSKNGSDFQIPVEYINQAKAYFLTIDMTEAQSQEIIGYINEGAELVEAQDFPAGTTVNFSSFSSAVKQELLALGQSACEVVGLTLTYDGSNVVIKDGATTVFNASPIVKATGASADMAAAVATAGIVLVVLGAAFIVAKKARLFVK